MRGSLEHVAASARHGDGAAVERDERRITGASRCTPDVRYDASFTRQPRGERRARARRHVGVRIQRGEAERADPNRIGVERNLSARIVGEPAERELSAYPLDRSSFDEKLSPAHRSLEREKILRSLELACHPQRPFE